MAWKTGDTVRLKSGGPLMTVEKVGRDAHQRDMVFTQWFDAAKVVTGYFPPESLAGEDDED
jgi:uncharacterized protein YodC (DUF2158 family)